MASEADGGALAARTVLVADDETDLLEAIRRVLTRRGYTVLPASSVEEAVRICRTHGGPIDLILADLRMPGGGGDALVRRARQHRPKLAALYMSGLADSSGLAAGQADGPIIGKPFTPHGLATAVEAALTAPGG